jgi:hypothetical protein
MFFFKDLDWDEIKIVLYNVTIFTLLLLITYYVLNKNKKAIKEVVQDVVTSFAEGFFYKCPDNSLYMYNNGELRPVLSNEIAKTWGYKGQNNVLTDCKNLNFGSSLTYFEEMGKTDLQEMENYSCSDRPNERFKAINNVLVRYPDDYTASMWGYKENESYFLNDSRDVFFRLDMGSLKGSVYTAYIFITGMSELDREECLETNAKIWKTYMDVSKKKSAVFGGIWIKNGSVPSIISENLWQDISTSFIACSALLIQTKNGNLFDQSSLDTDNNDLMPVVERLIQFENGQ